MERQQTPTSCMPQAWAATTPLLFMRALLRLDPWVPHEEVWLEPSLGRRKHLRLENIPLAQSRVDIDVRDAAVDVRGFPPAVTIHRVARRPLADLG